MQDVGDPEQIIFFGDKMRLQTSIEFIMIASAISLLALSAVTLYGKSIHSQDKFIGSLYANALNANALQQGNMLANPDNPQVLLYVPANSTVGRVGQITATFFGCTSGTASLSANSTALEFSSPSASGIAVAGVGTGSISFTPESQGPATVSINYSYTCGMQHLSGTRRFNTYALPNLLFAQGGNNSGGAPYADYAYISGRIERMIYPLKRPSPLTDVGTGYHCAQFGIFGHIFPAWYQCNSYNVWDYYTYAGNCDQWGEGATGVTCIYPTDMIYNLTSIDTQDVRYTYVFALSISTQKGVLSAAINDSRPVSQVFLNGKAIGNATIENVTGLAPATSVELVGEEGNYSTVNATPYNNYMSARSSLFGLLSYYNQTGISTPQQQSINAAILLLNRTIEMLLQSRSPIASCKVNMTSYACSPALPLSYRIRILVPKSADIANASVYYMESAIAINST